MVANFRALLAIAETERLLLYRTPKFWVLAGLGGLFVLLFMTGVTIASILDNSPPGEFLLSGTDAYIALYFFGYVQAVLIIFVAGDFRNAEEKARLDEVMLSRPITTATLVTGKFLGIAGGMLLINIVLILLSSAGRLVKVMVAGAGFSLTPALQYFALVTVPSVLFMTALVFFLISLLRLQTLAVLLPLGYVASILFYFQHKFYGLFDYGCFLAPIFYSDFIGFGALGDLLWQRAFFCALAFALLAFSILLYPRLRHSDLAHRLVQVMALASVAGSAAIAWHIISTNQQRQAARAAAYAAHASWVNRPVPDMRHAAMKIHLGGRQPIRVEARLALYAASDLDTLVFALNNGLKISRLQSASGSDLPFEHQNHLLIVDLGATPLRAGRTDTLDIAYAGEVDCEGILLGRPPGARGVFDKSNGPWVKPDISGWAGEDFVALPAQSAWYPTPGPIAGFRYPDTPRRHFFTASIDITAPQELAVLTQGIETGASANNGWRTTHFRIDTPVPGLSLNAGRYEILTHKFKQTEVRVFYHPNHLLDLDEFADIADTCAQAAQEILDIFEQVTGTPYPYPTLTLIEGPTHLQIFPGEAGVDNILNQPQVILFDEILFARMRFKNKIERATKRARRRGIDDSPARIKRDVFIDLLSDLLFGEWGEDDHSFYSPLLQYAHFLIDIREPVLARSLALNFHEMAERQSKDTFFPDRWDKSLSTNDRLRQSDNFTEWVFREIYRLPVDTVLQALARTPLSAFAPAKDPALYRAAVDFKGPPVIRMLQEKLGAQDFADGMHRLLETYRYAPVSRETFAATLQRHKADSVAAFLATWFDRTDFPGYRLTRATADKIDAGGTRILYQAVVGIQNGEKGEGFLQLAISTEHDKVWRNLSLASYEGKELYIALQEPPKRVEVFPYFSRNRGELQKQFSLSNRIRRGAPVDTVVRAVSAVDSLSFVVDDQDDGFFTPVEAVAKYLRPPLRGASWRMWTDAQAYGRYFFGWRSKRAGTGDFPARWEARVPRTGDYELSLYVPVNKGWYTRRLVREMKLKITDALRTSTVSVQVQETPDNWLPLGRFTFSTEKPAIVELLDEGSGVLIADAVRWEFIE